MSLALAIFAFFGVEVFCYFAFYNLEVGFLPGLGIAALVFFLYRRYQSKQDYLADNPPPASFRMPAPKAYATVKRTLKRFHWGERRWSIPDSDPTDLSIHAVSEWHDRSWKGHPHLAPDGSLPRKVVLDVQIAKNKTTGAAEVHMQWQVYSPITRSETNDLQRYTSEAILEALQEAQTGDRSGIDEDSEDD